jgi:hypothetical protein
VNPKASLTAAGKPWLLNMPVNFAGTNVRIKFKATGYQLHPEVRINCWSLFTF